MQGHTSPCIFLPSFLSSNMRKRQHGIWNGRFQEHPPTYFLPGVDPWPHSFPVQFPVPVKRDSEYLLYIPNVEDTQEGAGPPVQPLKQTPPLFRHPSPPPEEDRRPREQGSCREAGGAAPSAPAHSASVS